MNILFICSRNQWRSPTGELVWKKRSGFSVRSAGTSPRAGRTVNAKDISWADIIFVMEQKHKDRLRASFPSQTKYAKVTVLDIPDDYQYADPELIALIKSGTDYLLGG
ncbi:MAG: phosphotyrosine protein phosphatase [Maricaulaceae bacterium]